MENKPAEVFHPWVFIADELLARGWSMSDLAKRMGGDPDVNECSLDLYSAQHPGVLLDEETAGRIGAAFGTGPTIWLNLDKTWREHQAEGGTDGA